MSVAADHLSVVERRARITQLTRLGWPAWQIAFELGLSVRTVQRHRMYARAGVAGRNFQAHVIERRDAVRAMLEQGLGPYAIARKLGCSPATVYRDRYLLSVW